MVGEGVERLVREGGGAGLGADCGVVVVGS